MFDVFFMQKKEVVLGPGIGRKVFCRKPVLGLVQYWACVIFEIFWTERAYGIFLNLGKHCSVIVTIARSVKINKAFFLTHIK